MYSERYVAVKLPSQRISPSPQTMSEYSTEVISSALNMFAYLSANACLVIFEALSFSVSLRVPALSRSHAEA
ncbi:MAG: hypothetical protein BWY35_00449 [Firmicutes bacterium ADurb.Bin248]|nr:MAG: hypothetical protein BWY35_00449 [Firmicutes bacterium ADurb.Bin248]